MDTTTNPWPTRNESGELNLQQLISEGSLEFDEWTSLISHVEKTYPDDIDKICLVYDSFLSEYPLCHGYWRKYAAHKMRLCTIYKVVEVFEQAVQSATYSVAVWVDYCRFSMSVFEDPSDIRRLFQRATSFVGKDYMCHILWDKFIEFELSQQQWSSLAHIYVETLRFPTKKTHHYYNRFKTLISIWKKGMQSLSDSILETQSDSVVDGDVLLSNYNISQVVNDLLDPSVGMKRTNALHKYISIGEHFYKNACLLNERIQSFETRIRRSYYHVKPLDESQLDNWHKYLDFVEVQEDFDWAVKVYERCLISCADYPEFWMRYVDFMETKGGREIANFALDRATRIFVKRVPAVHLFYARFKEQIKDIQSARSSLFYHATEMGSNFIQSVVSKANMERRVGNITEASDIYKEALRVAAANGNSHALPVLYVHFSRFTYVTTKSADAAWDVLLDGIKNMPGCKLLLEELIKSAMMHGASNPVNVIKSVVDDALSLQSDASQSFSNEDKQDISNLYIEFIDLRGTIEDIRKAWNRHTRMFPKAMRCALPVHADSGKKSLVKSLGKGQETNLESTEHESDQRSKFLKNQVIQCGLTTVDLHQSSELGASSQELHMHSEISVPHRDSREETTEWKFRSHDLSRESGNEIHSEVSQEYDTRSQSLNPLSLEKLTLDPSGGGTPGSAPSTSQDCEASKETCMPNLSMQGQELNNSGDRHTSRDPSVDSALGQNSEFDGSLRLKTAIQSSASHPSYGLTQPHSQTQGPLISPRGWHQMNDSKRFGRDSKLGFHGHSNRRSKQRQFPSRKYPQTENGTQMPLSTGYSSQTSSLPNQIQQGIQGQNQCQPAAPSSNVANPSQNMQQPNVSACQIPAHPVSYPLAQMPQHSTQANQQYGAMQNNRAYQRMWQFYYYQQQQQQVLLQQQQLQQPQLHAQLQEQQLMEQQPLPHDQQLQLQLFYLQQQQLQSPAQQPQANQMPLLQQLQQQQQQQQYMQLYPSQPHLHDPPQQQPHEHQQHQEAIPSQLLEQREEIEKNQHLGPINQSQVQKSSSRYQQHSSSDRSASNSSQFKTESEQFMATSADQGVPSPCSADAVKPVASGA